MPIVHSSWDILKDKLLKCDLAYVDKRCGNRTLVFELDELEQDPNIPVISASKLHKWVKRRNSSSESTNQSAAIDHQETPQRAGPLSSKIYQSTQQQTSKPAQTNYQHTKATPKPARSKSKPKPKPATPKLDKPIPKPASTPKKPPPSPPQPSVEEQNSTSQNGSQSTQSSQASSEPDPTSASGASESSVVLWRSNVDALVISETMTDEFAMYANDDDEEEGESEYTRNRKKIKTTAPPAPQPQIPRPTQRARTPTPPPEVSSSSPMPQPPPPSTPPPPKPREPNWQETAKLLLDNEINTVYRDLDYFKNQAKNDKTARTILKDLVTKCVRDDETRLLLDILNLVYELSFEDDVEFWSELVLRFKRKLGSHGAAAFKNKINPEIIYENYRRAMLTISQYAKSVNLTVKLPFHTMTFLIDPVNNCNRVWAPEPEVMTVPTVIKVEKQENISPVKLGRMVTVGAKTISGRINFKVSKPRTGSNLKQRL